KNKIKFRYSRLDHHKFSDISGPKRIVIMKQSRSVMMLFSEHNFHRKTRVAGSIEVICGSMFSGKTEELIRRLRRAQLAQLSVEIFKPEMDKRYDRNEVVSHDRNTIPSTPVSHSSAILGLKAGTRVVGID